MPSYTLQSCAYGTRKQVSLRLMLENNDLSFTAIALPLAV
jgi:hypothetical protein